MKVNTLLSKGGIINILGFDIIVKITDMEEVVYSLQDRGMIAYNSKERFDGLYVPADDIIYIDKKLRIEERYRTLIHEAIEAINFRMGLHLKHSKIEALESGFATFMENFGKVRKPKKNT